MIWLFTILAFSLTLYLLLYPFWTRNPAPPLPNPRQPLRQRRNLRERKAQLLLAIRELDFDYEMKKLSVEDYKKLRATYEAQAVETLRELETVEASWREALQKIDAEIARRFGIPPAARNDFKAAPETAVVEKTCPACGFLRPPTARFCQNCGAPLPTEASNAS